MYFATSRINSDFRDELTYIACPLLVPRGCDPRAQAYSKAQAAGKDFEVVYVPVADSEEVRSVFFSDLTALFWTAILMISPHPPPQCAVENLGWVVLCTICMLERRK